ncbi:MAG: ABC transporter permease subunit [Candidatus Latescibacteria bacterium]|nr:ABC transporter permease subunit [Candidatus Latescibacterota bacterium]
MFGHIAFIAGKELRFLLREKWVLVWVFLMPILFFYFIGTLTSGGVPGIATEPLPLALVQTDTSGYLTDQLARRLADNGFIPIPAARPPNKGMRYLVLPPQFEKDVLRGRSVSLTYRSPASGPLASYEKLRLQKAAYALLADMVVASPDSAPATATDLARFNGLDKHLQIETMSLETEFSVPSGFAQAIPGLIVMFAMFVLITNGALLALLERQQGMGKRLASTPIRKGEIVAGKWLGKMLLGSFQVGIGMTIGSLAYGMEWGANWPIVIAVLLAWASFCAALGLSIGNLATSEIQVNGLGWLLTIVLAALGGCWWPIEVMPPAMQTLQKCLPSGWAMDALHRLIHFGQPPTAVWPHLLALIAATLMLNAATVKHWRHD